MREGKLTIVDSDKPYLWAEDATDVVEVKLTPYIERKLKKYGYRWQWQPEIQWGIWVGPGGYCRTTVGALKEIQRRLGYR